MNIFFRKERRFGVGKFLRNDPPVYYFVHCNIRETPLLRRRIELNTGIKLLSFFALKPDLHRSLNRAKFSKKTNLIILPKPQRKTN